MSLIYAAQDPGGFNAISPVIKELPGKLFHGENLSQNQVDEIVEDSKPDAIITGTGHGDSLDKKFIRAGNKLNIPTFAVLDFWVNYSERFEDSMPTKIFVMDETAKQEMIEEGLPEEKIVITGNPFFDTFEKVEGEGEIISFFSQPFTEIEDSLGLNEVESLEAIAKIFAGEKIKAKLHPKCAKTDKFDHIEGVEITEESVEDLIQQSKVVTGLNSMVLFQSCVMGRKVLSYQPGLRIKDPLISNRLGISKAVYKEEDLKQAAEELIQEELKTLKAPKNATQNVIKEINEYCLHHPG